MLFRCFLSTFGNALYNSRIRLGVGELFPRISTLYTASALKQVLECRILKTCTVISNSDIKYVKSVYKIRYC